MQHPKRKRKQYVLLAAFCLGCGLLFGVIALNESRAAWFAVANEVESGVIGGSASKVSENGASNQSAIKFGASVPATGRVVNVSSASQLIEALADARPGDTIRLADGLYSGKFIAAKPATKAERITITGSRAAILDAGGTGSGYVLHLDNADYYTIKGISVRNGQKGIMADNMNHGIIEDVEVSGIGHEAVHLRKFSTDNIVRDSDINNTGKTRDDFGEGIYVGSAESNWDTISGGEPDASDRNQLLDNTITATGAESIDLKEGTKDGVVRRNTFDGAGMTGAFADSWIDVKGNDYLIEQNTGKNTPLDGFQTHVIVAGYGIGNEFKANTMQVSADGYGINIQTSKGGEANFVRCDNKMVGPSQGLSNIECT